jgi:hypothetical protein
MRFMSFRLVVYTAVGEMVKGIARQKNPLKASKRPSDD